MIQKSHTITSILTSFPRGVKLTIFGVGKSAFSSVRSVAVMYGLDWKVHHHLAQLYR